jgi:ubiquinone/menaquinone biosynthesis C-methylase UbiE
MDHLLELTGRAEATHFWFRGFRRFVRPMLDEVAGGRRDLRMLDCGCGTGGNLELLRPYGRPMGFDLTDGGLDLARPRQLPIARADITRIPFLDNTFDLVTAFDVLQCVPDDARAVGEMMRVLKPGGAVIATVAAFDVLSGDHAAVWHEVRRYRPDNLGRLVADAGLTAHRIKFLFGSLFPLMLAVRVTQRLLRPYRALRPDTDIAVPSAPVNALLTGVVQAEAALSRLVPMPIGTSLLVVARKPAAAGALSPAWRNGAGRLRAGEPV